MTLKPDICIVGGGAAGVASALAAAQAGASCVLVEKDKLGGAYLNSGEVPAHALSAAGAKAAAIAEADAFGVSAGKPKVDLFQVREHLHRAVATVAPDYAAERLTALGIHVIRHTGTFTAPDTLATDDVQIKAGAFVVATGSVPLIPAIDGLADGAYLTYENLFDLTALPRHLILLGAQAYDLAVAQAYGRLGAEVTVLTPGPLLPDEDPECVDVLRLALARDGVTIRENVTAETVSRARGKVTVVTGGESLEGSHLLIAGDRRPAVEGLGLRAAKAVRGAGELKVDAQFRTDNSRIYAVGDVTGGRTSHAARLAAIRVIGAIRGQAGADAHRDVAVRVVPTDPPLAHAGLRESDAKMRRIDAAILRRPFADNDKAVVTRRVAGHVKAVVAATGRILGVTIVGPCADDLIAPWVLAIANGLDIRSVAGLVLPSSTLGETSVETAKSFEAVGLTASRLQRIIGKIRREH